jgi:hypothetical protein
MTRSPSSFTMLLSRHTRRRERHKKSCKPARAYLSHHHQSAWSLRQSAWRCLFSPIRIPKRTHARLSPWLQSCWKPIICASRAPALPGTRTWADDGIDTQNIAVASPAAAKSDLAIIGAPLRHVQWNCTRNSLSPAPALGQPGIFQRAGPLLSAFDPKRTSTPIGQARGRPFPSYRLGRYDARCWLRGWHETARVHRRSWRCGGVAGGSAGAARR